MNSILPTNLVPIVVAVTGHRDIPLEDVSLLSSMVSAQLRDISARYPDSPCLLLSGLAEGADRLVARCTVELGWRVGAVLPLAQQEYEKDFKDERSVLEFRELLARAVWVRELSSTSTTRPACYQLLGAWLARSAQILIALWDGGPSSGPGGTADVVKTFREGVAPERLIPPDAGPVIHVYTHRTRDAATNAVDAIGGVKHLPACPGGLGGVDEESRWEAVLGRINQFNRDLSHAWAATRPPLVAAVKPTSLPEWNESGEVERRSSASLARHLFLAADAMSIKAQKERDTLFKGLLALSAAAIILAQVYAGLFTKPILLGSALVLSGVGFIWHFVWAGRHVEQRYLDYRALAEACKVQYFWKIAGIADCAADFYLREQRDELEWIRQAIQTTELGANTFDDMQLEARLKFVRDAWIDDQLRYFSGDERRPGGKAALNRLMDDIWSKRSQKLFVGGMALALVTVMFQGLVIDPASEVQDWILKSMIVVYSLIFGAAGLARVFQENRAFSEHAKQYQRMGLTLQLARSRLDAALAAGELALAVSVVKSIGIEALAENGNWLLIHRERPVSAQGIG